MKNPYGELRAATNRRLGPNASARLVSTVARLVADGDWMLRDVGSWRIELERHHGNGEFHTLILWRSGGRVTSAQLRHTTIIDTGRSWADVESMIERAEVES